MRDQKKERRGLRAFGRKQDGVMAVIFVICMPLIIGVCALVIDLGYAWMTRNQLQATADASSLAAASKLSEISSSDTSVAVAEANALAEANMPSARHGDVLADSDIVFGFFSPITWQFNPGITPYNAVRTTTRRAAANNNPLNAIFAVIFGKEIFEVNTPSTAADGKWDDFLSCLHALNPTAEDSLYVFGNATINAVGCDIQVDSCPDGAPSTTGDAFTAQGNPLILSTAEEDGGAAGSIKVCGEYNQVGGSVDIDPCEDTNPSDGQCDMIEDESGWQLGDPWGNIVQWGDASNTPSATDHKAELPVPSTNTDYCAGGTGTTTINVSGTVQFPPASMVDTKLMTGSPGPYGDVWQFCGEVKFTGNGTVEFQEGTYLYQGGFTTVGNVSLKGEDMGPNGLGWNTFIMDGTDSRIDMGGTSDIDLRAPGFTDLTMDGDGNYNSSLGYELAGFLWIGDPDQKSSYDCHLMKGTSGSATQGINYFPNDCIEFKGTADSGMDEANCSVYIADTFYFNGDVELTVNSDCSALNSADGVSALNVPLRLVM